MRSGEHHHNPSRALPTYFISCAVAFSAVCCTGDGSDAGPNINLDTSECDADNPLRRSDWVGFCADRVDDNCKLDVDEADCPVRRHGQDLCLTLDEPCPTTQPASAPPAWDCTGTPPANVIAYAHDSTGNEQVSAFCTFVYESPAEPGAHYAAVQLVDGPDPWGPAHPASLIGTGYCSHDRSARKHLFYTNLSAGGCPSIRYNYPDAIENQHTSNHCRKMIRFVGAGGNNSGFSPHIQYFAASRSEALGKLDVLDTAEIACVGIDNIQSGEPFRREEEFYVQASAPFTLVPSD